MIKIDEESIQKIRRELLEEDMQRIISDWKQMGLRKEEVIEMMGVLWEKEDWENER